MSLKKVWKQWWGKDEKPKYKPAPPPRERDPKDGRRLLYITNDVLGELLPLAYLIGDLEINGVGQVKEEDGVIYWTKAWVLSDIDDLRAEKKERDEESTNTVTYETVKNGEKVVRTVKRKKGVASTASVEIDNELMAKLLFDVVSSGGNPKDLRLYWHTHGLGEAFWSNTDLKAVDNEVITSNGAEVINVVMSPGHFLARIDSGLVDKQAENLPVEMEGEDEQRYYKTGSLYQTKYNMSYQSIAGWYSASRSGPSWEHDSIGLDSDRSWFDYPSAYWTAPDDESEQCSYCQLDGEIDTTTIAGQQISYCTACFTVLDGELEGCTIF